MFSLTGCWHSQWMLGSRREVVDAVVRDWMVCQHFEEMALFTKENSRNSSLVKKGLRGEIKSKRMIKLRSVTSLSIPVKCHVREQNLYDQNHFGLFSLGFFLVDGMEDRHNFNHILGLVEVVGAEESPC